jgi:hypothetical protein
MVAMCCYTQWGVWGGGGERWERVELKFVAGNEKSKGEVHNFD